MTIFIGVLLQKLDSKLNFESIFWKIFCLYRKQKLSFKRLATVSDCCFQKLDSKRQLWGNFLKDLLSLSKKNWVLSDWWQYRNVASKNLILNANFEEIFWKIFCLCRKTTWVLSDWWGLSDCVFRNLVKKLILTAFSERSFTFIEKWKKLLISKLSNKATGQPHWPWTKINKNELMYVSENSRFGFIHIRLCSYPSLE